MTERVEQRYCIKFCQNLRICKVKYFVRFSRECFNHFIDTQTLVASDQHSSRPSTSLSPCHWPSAQFWIRKDRKIAADIEISDGSSHAILTDDLGMRRVAGNLCPSCFHVSSKSTALTSRRACWNVPVVIPTSWRPRSLMMRLGCTGTTQKPMLSRRSGSLQGQRKLGRWGAKSKWCWQFFFFYYHFVVHHEYAPEGLIVKRKYYREVLCHPCDAIRHKRLELWNSGNWQLHLDNAVAYSSHQIQYFLAKHGMPQSCQAPY